MNFHGRRKTWKVILFSILTFGLILSMGSMMVIHSLYQKNFPRYDRPEYSGYLQFSDLPDDARSIVYFPSGENRLAGYIFGEENTKGLVVLAPGRGEGVENYLAEILYFVDHGWRVLSFDYTGSYASEGKNSVGLPQSRIDLQAALAYIQSNPKLNKLPVVLWGHSWGGYAVAAVLKDHAKISAVASISGFNSPLGLMDEQIRKQFGVLGIIGYPFEWIYQALRFGPGGEVTAVDGINNSDTPVMIVHGSADDSISYNGASIIARRGQITNTNMVYKTCDAANHNGHKDLLRSEAAGQYINQKNQEYQALLDRYHGTVPDSARAAFYAAINRFQTSEVDAVLMQEINSFFESTLVN